MATKSSATVGKAFSVLSLFRDHPIVTVAICEAALEIPRSTAHRLLVSLREAGVLEQINGGHYVLSLDLFELGVRAPQRRMLDDRIGVDLEAIAYSTGLRANVGVQRGLEVVYIASASGQRAQSQGIRTRVGYRGPLHATAMGKIFLAYSDDSLLERMLASELETYTSQTVIDEAPLREELAEIRAQSYAFSVGQYQPFATAVAVPIRSWDGSVRAALSLVGDNTTMLRQRAQLIKDVRRTAERIEKGIGGTFKRRSGGSQAFVVST